MKKFEIIAKFGRKIFYKSLVTFTEDQEKEYLEKVLKYDDVNKMFSGELQAIVIKATNTRSWQKNADMWDNITRKECVEKYPDYAICAHIMVQFYEFFSNGEVYLDIPKSSEHIQENYQFFPSWSCKRIK